MKYQPINDHILIVEAVAKTETDTGIILPGTTDIKKGYDEVIAVCDEATPIKPGDRVILLPFQKIPNLLVKLDDGREGVLVHYKYVIAVVED